MRRFLRKSTIILMFFSLLMYLCACGTISATQSSPPPESTDAEPPSEYVLISLGFNVHEDLDDDRLSYTASTEGIVQEVEYDEYYDWAYELAKADIEDGMEVILDIELPGLVNFYFKGVSPGEVTLVFSGGGNVEETSYMLRVLDDLTVQIIE